MDGWMDGLLNEQVSEWVGGRYMIRSSISSIAHVHKFKLYAGHVTAEMSS